MKSTLKFLSASALLTLSSAFILTGCPDDGTGEDCTLNTDCEAGLICDTDTNECVSDGETCTGNVDCTVEGEFCITSPDNSGESICAMPASCADIAVDAEKNAFCGGDGEFCIPPAGEPDGDSTCRVPANCTEAPDALAYCRAQLGVLEEVDVACNAEALDVDNGCEVSTVTEHYYVMVRDTTTDDCDLATDANGFDPGSDISFVELSDASGMQIGYGRTAQYNYNADASNGMNDFQVAEVLDGGAPEFVDGAADNEDVVNRCPEGIADNPDDRINSGRFNPQTVLTLGCQGNVIVDFPASPVSDTSNLQPIYNGYTVTVGEFAPVCNQNDGGDVSGSDKYEVFVCPAVEAGMIPTDIDCTIQISDSDVGGLKVSSVMGTKDAPMPPAEDGDDS